MTGSAPSWPEDIFRALVEMDVRQVAHVPDAGHAQLIAACEADAGMTTVPLTTEEEGIALLAGAWLGGQRGVLLMQSSGVGNCVNMLALTRTCRFPLLMLVTMRGEAGEANPWQAPMGRIAGRVLELAGVRVRRIGDPGVLGEAVRAAGREVFDAPDAAAILISQQLVGVKSFEE